MGEPVDALLGLLDPVVSPNKQIDVTLFVNPAGNG